MISRTHRQLFLVRGLSGSGKSTLADLIVDAYDAVKCEADDYFLKDGVYHWDRSKVQQAHLQCHMDAANALRRCRNVVVANTFTQIWHMEPYIAMAMMQPPTRVYICESNTSWAKDPEECIRRNSTNIPKELVYNQVRIWEEYVDYGNVQVSVIKPERNDEWLFNKKSIFFQGAH